MILAFLLPAFIAGVAVVYALPLVQGWIAKAPGAARFTNNKIIQLFIIGAVIVLVLHLFIALVSQAGRKV